jgi:hypothetical protein
MGECIDKITEQLARTGSEHPLIEPVASQKELLNGYQGLDDQ